MAKKEVKATYLQLKGAFKNHGKVSEEGERPSHHLLKFYANECGLKALFMKDNNLDDTSEFAGKVGKSSEKYGHGHDLISWINEMKIPGFVIPFEDNENDPIVKVHEKLRYGVETKAEHIANLRSLYSLLKKHLLR